MENKEVIDVTPTWSSLLPVMLDVHRNSKNIKAVRDIEEEFRRMAQVADAYVAHLKQQANGK